jgi:iron(III) transport system permease protein
VGIAVLACAARFVFVGIAGADAALARLKPEFDEAAALSGASWQRRALGIDIPLSLPWLAGIWGLSFLLAFGEVDATLLVMPPGVTTLPVRILGLMHYGPSQLVAALSVSIAGVVAAGAVLTVAACLFARRRLHAHSTSR